MIFSILLINGCKNQLEQKSTSVKQELSQVMEIGTEKGNLAPDFVVMTTEGKTVRLRQFANEKKPVLVYFMATWCPWCAQDFAALSKLYGNYENNVSIVALDMDLNEDTALLRDYKSRFPELDKVMFATGQSDILVDYGVTRTTTKYAIDRSGKIIWAGSGAFGEKEWKILLNALSG